MPEPLEVAEQLSLRIHDDIGAAIERHVGKGSSLIQLALGGAAMSLTFADLAADNIDDATFESALAHFCTQTRDARRRLQPFYRAVNNPGGEA